MLTNQQIPSTDTQPLNRGAQASIAPLIHRTMTVLKPGAAFVLNIGSRIYPLNERLMNIAEGHYAVEKQKGRLSASNGLGKDGEGETFYEIRNPSGVIILTSAQDAPNTEPMSQSPAETTPVLDEPRKPAAPSALDFVFRSEPLPAVLNAPSAEPNQPSSEPESPVLSQTDAVLTAFHASLATRGHRLLTRDGKFFVSEASRLTVEDRAAIKQHREALIALAEEWTDGRTTADLRHDGVTRSGAEQDADRDDQRSKARHMERSLLESDEPDITSDATSRAAVSEVGRGRVDSLFADNRPSVSLAQFLGSEPQRHDPHYTPDEPPDLTGIDEVILNFATTGLNWHAGDRPCGVTISTLDGQMCRFLPFAFAGGNLSEETVKRWAKEQLRNKKITNSKTKFDIHHSREWGIDLESQGCTFSDIQHTAALLDDHRKRFGLDVLAAHYFPGEQFALRLDETQHHRFIAGQAAEREKETTRLVGRLRAILYPEIDAQDLRRVQDLEDGVIPAVVEMEKNGSPINMALLEQYGVECNKKHDELMWEVSRECGFAFEHTASGWKRLIESLNLPVPDSFSESVLNEVDHPLIRKGQRAAQYASLNSKIFKAYPEHIVDGVLRYNINQLASDEGGTVSGRFSIGIVQQVPNADNHEAIFGNELFPRRLFISGSGDYFEGDAAQIEFRLLVHHSENAKLLQAYRDDPWMSFHKKMQEMLVVYKSDMLYAHTKNYNFASQYGAKSIKLAVMMGFITEREGDEIRKAKRWDDPRLKTIKEIEAAYKRAHPEAGALLDRAAHLAKSKCDDFCKKGDAMHRQFPHRGYVKTLLGRRSRFPTNYKTYIGLNRVLQGTGADIMKRKLVELHNARKDTGFVMRITNHDAVLGDATAPETLECVSKILNRQSFDVKVPILWKCGTGRTWADCK